MFSTLGPERVLETVTGPRPFFRISQGTRPQNWACRSCNEHVVLWQDGEIASFVGILQAEVVVNGQSVPVGGLGYGATQSKFERQGCLTAVVNHACEILKYRGAPIIVLTCLDTLAGFYRKHGWVQVDSKVPPEIHVMVKGIAPTWSSIKTIEFKGLPW